MINTWFQSIIYQEKLEMRKGLKLFSIAIALAVVLSGSGTRRPEPVCGRLRLFAPAVGGAARGGMGEWDVMA